MNFEEMILNLIWRGLSQNSPTQLKQLFSNTILFAKKDTLKHLFQGGLFWTNIPKNSSSITKRALTFLIVSPKATVGATIWVAFIMQTLHRQCLNFPQTFRLQQLQCTINVKQPFENTRPRWIVGRVKSSRVSFSRLTLRTQKKDKISWIQKVSNKGFCCLSYFFS